MSTLMIPESLKQVLRKRYELKDTFMESEQDHEWTITYSFSEWSGYHDECNYYSYSTSVLDHEPVLSDRQEWYRTEMLPQNKEMYEKLLHEYNIADIYEIHKSCGYPEYYSRIVIKLDCPDPEYHYTNPLWILDEDSKSR